MIGLLNHKLGMTIHVINLVRSAISIKYKFSVLIFIISKYISFTA